MRTLRRATREPKPKHQMTYDDFHNRLSKNLPINFIVGDQGYTVFDFDDETIYYGSKSRTDDIKYEHILDNPFTDGTPCHK
jgi:hypothetical protein